MAKKLKLSEAQQIVRKIQKVCGVYLLEGDALTLRPKKAHRTWGCCYVASEALFHLWGKKNGFKPYYVRCYYNSPYAGPKMRVSDTHWFLSNGKVRIDPTYKQFGRRKPKYKDALCCGFMTKQPSNRGKELIRRIKAL